jgi:7 transmembrane helices usually fused to an inactive transglutaminase/Transglutaminase-like superfamily
VTLVVQGTSLGDARLMTTTPLDFGRQHILQEGCKSAELLAKPPDAKHPHRHYVLWTRRGGAGQGTFRAHYEFKCVVDVHRPTSSMTQLARSYYAAPAEEEHLEVPARPTGDGPSFSSLAADLTSGTDDVAERALVLFHFVDQEIANEPALGGMTMSGAECLKNNSGNSGGKSRLLMALLRSQGIPARLVQGLTLARGQQEQLAHYWVEAWIDGHWNSYCPFHHHAERVPGSYLVLGFGDTPMARGKEVSNLRYAFLVERITAEDAMVGHVSILKRWLLKLSFYMLPPAEQKLVEFLLLLPIAALIVCLFRNVIGLASFGTFAPALIGLAFRDLHSMPGMLVFVSIVLIGWVMRRVLNGFHLLQVPRSALLLSLVVLLLISAIVFANIRELPATRYVALFPMVILTGMVERFWTLETEDGAASSFKTLFGTLFISLTIAMFLSLHAVMTHMVRYPESLGLIMACLLLLGRYTGYRLSELYRFRDFIQQKPGMFAIHSE